MPVLRPIRGAKIMNTAIPVVSPPANIQRPSGTKKENVRTGRNHFEGNRSHKPKSF